MKVLIVNKFLKVVGGSERYIFTLNELFKREGIETVFFGMQDNANEPETNNEYLKVRIENEIDFSKYNLLVTCRYEGTGSYVHFANVKDNKVNIYSYCGEVVTEDIAFKSLIIPVKKEYNLDEIEVKYHYEIFPW